MAQTVEPDAALGVADALGLERRFIITAPTDSSEHVRESPSPLDPSLVAIFPHWKTATVRSSRHVGADSLGRAVNWGLLLFGARAFAVYEGPARMRNRFLAAAVSENLAVEDLKPAGQVDVSGTGGVRFTGVRYWQTERFDQRGRRFVLRALVTAAQEVLFPDGQTAVTYVKELDATPEALQAIEPGAALQYTFRPAIGLLGGRKPAELTPAKLKRLGGLLSELDAEAFDLLAPGEDGKGLGKGLVLDALVRNLDILPAGRIEGAILQLFRSFDDLNELKAARATLTPVQDQRLFSRLDAAFFPVLQRVGELSPKQGDLTLAEFLGFLEDLVRSEVKQELKDIVELPQDPDDPVYAPDRLADLDAAAFQLLAKGRQALGDLVELVSEPWKVVEALGQLVKLLQLAGQALNGDQQARDYLSELIAQMNKGVVNAFRGADELGIAQTFVLRLKWMIVWEALSWLTGAGQYVTVYRGARRAAERAKAFMRLVRATGSVVGGADLLKLSRRFRQLAKVIRELEEGALASLLPDLSDDDVIRLMSYLPDADAQKLAATDKAVDLANVTDFATLKSVAPGLAAEVDKLSERVHVLARTERAAGAFTDDMSDVLKRLGNRFPDHRFDMVLSSLARAGDPAARPRANLHTFAAAVRAIPPAALATRQPPFFEYLASSQAGADFLARNGYQAFANLLERADRKFHNLERHLDALDRMSQTVPEAQRAQRYQQVIAAIASNDKATLDQVAGFLVKRGRSRSNYRQLTPKQRADALAAKHIKAFDKLTEGIDPIERGNLFEAWLRPQLHKLVNKDGVYQRMRVYLDKNQHLEEWIDEGVWEIDLDGRKYFECDGFRVEADGSHFLFDAKAYYSSAGGQLDRAQLWMYHAMSQAPSVTVRVGGADKTVKIGNAFYIFPNREAAVRRLPELDETAVEVWYIAGDDLVELNR